jgi:hypothetical protein
LPLRSPEVSAPTSAFSPHFRFLSDFSLKALALGALERLPLWFGFVERFVLSTHARALGRVLAALPCAPRTIGIIGGGLFPRSLLLLGRSFPEARISVIDLSARNVELARSALAARDFDVSSVRFLVEPFDPARHAHFDLLVAPLAFVGEASTLARSRSAVLTHDWIWRRGGSASAVVSWLLLKRVRLALPSAR